MTKTDEDIGSYLTGKYDKNGISECRVDNFESFIKLLGEAISKREANSQASTNIKKKYHMIIRLKIVDEQTMDKTPISMVDFLELTESSFLINKKHFEASELEWLNESFNSLFDLLV